MTANSTPESFDAVLAEAPTVIHDLRSLGEEGYVTCSAAADMLEAAIAAHARELAEQQATIEALRNEVAKEKSAANHWFSEANRDHNNLFRAEARADAAAGLLRKARSRVADISRLGAEIDAFLAEQALAGGERKDVL